MESPDFYTSNSIETFEIDKISEVSLIDIVKVDDRIFGSFDILINTYYKDRLDLLPALYAFNGIIDPTDIYLGRLIKIPDIDSLESLTKINTIFIDDNVPGISKSMNNKIQNKNIKKQNSQNITTALPKLGITLKSVSYNEKTGNLTF